jgi:cell division protein FtsW (lipid II flippase)
MNTNTKNIIIGAVVASLCATIIIYSIEENKSFLQILSGFLLFVFPISFISVFKSKVGVFILVFASAMSAYFAKKLEYEDVWIGLLFAIIIGGSTFYFRVRRAENFSPHKYESEQKSQHKKNKNNA